MTTITFTLIGKPQPKGAHTSFVPKRKDGSYATWPGGRPKVVTKDTNVEQEVSQQSLAMAALVARNEAGLGIWDGPVETVRRYYFQRPKNHYGTGRNVGVLKSSAPEWPLTAADIDKLDRLVFDALTGTVLRDDKQIVRGWHEKLYADPDEPARTEVEVTLIEQKTVGVQQSDDQLALVA